MHFFNPANWLWMLPLLGAIILLWRHRPRREEIVVPSLRLWQDPAVPATAEPPRRQVQRHLLLFLQLLAAFLLALALARPFFAARAPAGQTYVLVVDNGASMQAIDVKPTRLDAARVGAARFIATLMRSGDRAMVIQTGPRAAALCPLTADPALLRTALAQIAPTDAPGDMAGALSLAQAQLGSTGDAHVRVYSDGTAAASLAAFTPSPLDVRQITVGTTHPDNVGIVGLELQPGDPGTQTLSVTLRSSGSSAPAGLTTSLSVDGALRDARQVTFTGNVAQASFILSLANTAQVAQVTLDGLQDNLASDNRAAVVLPPVRTTRVLLVSSGNVFLERGLSSLPNVAVTEAAPAPYSSLRAAWAASDVVVLDGPFPLSTVPPGRYLTFARAGAPTPFTFTPQPSANVDITREDSAHPAMRFVEMRGVRVQTAARADAAGWAQVLAGSENGPLLAAGEVGGSRVVSAAFSLSDTDWPLRAAFPLFLANSVAWLAAGRAPGSTLPQYAAGQAARITLPPGTGTAQLTRPDGTVRALSVPPAGGSALLPDTDEVGIYTVAAPNSARYPVAVNLLNPAATALTPVQAPLLNQPKQSALSTLRRTVRREWWTVAATAALLLLLLEWWVYHRRLAAPKRAPLAPPISPPSQAEDASRQASVK